MNRVSVGAPLCVAAFWFSMVDGGRTRQAIGTFALEQLERLFDVVENVFHFA